MHIHKKTKSGADVFVLDKESKIDSEAEAMLQALHSRSVGGFLNHIKVLEEKGAENFMSKFYVGYGHKSIGDCGSITIFIEGVSMLCAKAIQDTKLYSGQEASTRYIDFSQQNIINPLKNKEGEELLEKQRKFYLGLIPKLEKHIKKIHPIEEGQHEKVYNKTVSAKAFDIARGFLPAGFSTNLARHSNLRQVADRITRLRHHPLPEVREIAETILDAVIEKYPSSFTKKTYEESETYYEKTTNNYYYLDTNVKKFKIEKDYLDKNNIIKYKQLFEERPNGKTELPTFLDLIGTLEFEYQLDFGSFRDIQRHRAVYQRMPLLTDRIGFHERYLDSLPDEVKLEAQNHLNDISTQIQQIQIDDSIKQYYIPMGYKISGKIIGTLPALVYLAELRSSTYVHPSLRPIAIKLGEYLESEHQIKVFLDKKSDEFDVRRGKQDIELK